MFPGRPCLSGAAKYIKKIFDAIEETSVLTEDGGSSEPLHEAILLCGIVSRSDYCTYFIFVQELLLYLRLLNYLLLIRVDELCERGL